jgi:hypothetical protein
MECTTLNSMECEIIRTLEVHDRLGVFDGYLMRRGSKDE